ncbi:aminodeoxychorismate/anthranilate synthase component II [Mixta theicola]|uniref:Aminodeoxychorismate/anthranilate synthase component II n=1 Tax=Mixta theicola TaxID=1458355 RepID=A0A2K1Q6J7_9GAMM|nr:aminodeoxychorismate/anthranilate synthase component II [Mixta theicola]PNS10674.1 aminodeoxychorismate/anthranilate synthase component II [Mixta theicola]GLR10937.1 aminodeoxychorismate/anthranilate synthase component II [Mixta theicola]
MKFLLVDAYDSFVYIIKNYIENIGLDIEVVRCDKIDITDLEKYQAIVLGPGPGHPTECGYLDIIRHSEGKIPILGICLGMQAIAEYYGVPVTPAVSRQHGKVSKIENDAGGCFRGLPSVFNVTRYHSLVAERKYFNDTIPLVISATSMKDGYVMGIRHKKYCIEGVQFHPESVTTEYGKEMIRNFFLQAI